MSETEKILETYLQELSKISEKLKDMEPEDKQYAALMEKYNWLAAKIVDLEDKLKDIERREQENAMTHARAEAERLIQLRRLELEEKKFKAEKIYKRVETGTKIGTTVVAVGSSIFTVCYITAMELKGEIPNRFLSPVITKMIDVIGRLRI